MPLPSFFDEPAGPAVLKHGLLRRYLYVFGSKTGARSPGRRVVYVDGYAGAGRYANGDDGSPRVALEVAQQLAELGGRGPRTLDCVFVEEDPEVRAELVKHVPTHMVRRGRIQDHLDEILELARGVPLFLFLDPYGMTLDVETITNQVLNRPAAGQRLATTEVLVNFASHAIRREGGHLFSESPSPATASIIEGMNRFLDGEWWQDLWGTSPEADREIAEGWARRINARAPSYDTLPMGVPTRWQGDPLYYLALVTSHRQGGWYFADALRGSLNDFYRFTVGNQPQLFDPDHLADVAVDKIADNLLALIEERGAVVLGDVTRELYGETLGFAGIKEIRRAVKMLHARGQVDHNGVGDLDQARVGAGPTPALL